jgi:hypothetical protein
VGQILSLIERPCHPRDEKGSKTTPGKRARHKKRSQAGEQGQASNQDDVHESTSLAISTPTKALDHIISLLYKEKGRGSSYRIKVCDIS